MNRIIHNLCLSIIIALLHLLPSVACFNHHNQLPDTGRGFLFEGKTRLGSGPPSCHNKCKQCHPCMAAQVPPLPPSRNRFQPGLNRATHSEFLDSSSSATPFASFKFSNYKPLRWKCRCGHHFFNP